MGLRSRTIWLGGTLLSVLLGTAYLVLSLFLRSSFHYLEENSALRDAHLAVRAMEREAEELDAKAVDWSDWDESYRYLENRDSAFIRSNLAIPGLGNMRLRCIAFLDTAGNMISGIAQNDHNSTSIPVELLSWGRSQDFKSALRSGRTLKGWMEDANGPTLVVAKPVRLTSGKGQYHGSVIFARNFDPRELSRLGRIFPFTLHLKVAPRSAGKDSLWSISHFQDSLRVEHSIPTLDGKSLVVGITSPPSFQHQKQFLLWGLAITFLLGIVAFAVSGIVLIERLVLQRLLHLEHDVAGIAAGSSLRILIPGNDEISRLGRNIDAMVESLRKMSSEIRRTRDVAERAERAKTRLLASVSHEMRTPLNGILGLTDLLQKSPAIAGEDMDGIEMINEAGCQLLLTVNTLLDHSRLETGELSLGLETFAIEKMVQKALAEILPTARRKQLSVHVEFDLELQHRRNGDPERTAQILRNLLDNAVKFTSRGEVRLRVFSGQQEDQLCFEVTDTGIGIAPERHSAIFSPFEQAREDTFLAFGGTGLGLSICRMLSQLMGGEIQVKSQQDKGSSFLFTAQLPAAPGSHRIVEFGSWKGLQGGELRLHKLDSASLHILTPILTMVGIVAEVVEDIDPEDPRPVLSTQPRPETFSGRHFQLRPFEHSHVEEHDHVLFEPFLPNQVLAACCQLFHRKQTVGLWIPNAVLRTLVAGILRRAGHLPLPLDAPPEHALELPQVVLIDVRPDQAKELQQLEEGLRLHPQQTWLALIPGDEAPPPQLSGVSAWIRKPIEPGTLIRAVEGWDRPAHPT
jgi:signal transduction histidine kinase